jgi:Kef-type K+ transport system membrane component KefB
LDSAAVLTRLDSLYAARDTSGLAAAVRAASDTTIRVRFYRGMSAAWSRRSRDAIAILKPIVDSSPSSLAQTARRDALSALVESYARTRQYSSAAETYGKELATLDGQIAKLRDSAGVLEKKILEIPEPVLDAATIADPTPPPAPEKIPGQLGFIALLFTLFLLPKLLQRFRIPSAITSLLLGAGATGMGLFRDDPTILLLSTLGIVALFLFAGLEVDGRDLQGNASALVLHGAIWTALAIIVAIVSIVMLDVSLRVGALLALALVTPSTGFILSSLGSFGLTTAQQKAVRTYAVGSELIALTALFFVLQATSAAHLVVAIAAMTGVVIAIPLAFRFFASMVAPYAPKSEFAFLLLVAVVCAYATRLLGVYYLVGAFLVGIAAQRFRSNHPDMSSEKMVDALESFGSVFIPFYFFHAGTEIAGDHLTARAIVIGVGLVLVLVPIRVGLISLHRRLALNEGFKVSRRVSSALVPTLVFTLVIVRILEDRYALATEIAGGLVLYTILNTMVPGFILHAGTPDFEDPEAMPVTGVSS